ncbi:MAG TPA: hypothetical protein VK674_05250 [Candidatus Limnocylindria bacterium]|nr:hypothetical protein [Candidatus Limnocylindria bacterium]
MDQQYKDIYREVQRLRYKLQDLLDDPAHRLARTLRDEVQRLEDEIEMSKKPRSLEDRVKLIQRQLVAAGDGGANRIMDIEHADFLHDAFEDLRRTLRRFPHY